MSNPPLHNAIWYMQFYSSQSCSPAELCYASNCSAEVQSSMPTTKLVGEKFNTQFDPLRHSMVRKPREMTYTLFCFDIMAQQYEQWRFGTEPITATNAFRTFIFFPSPTPTKRLRFLLPRRKASPKTSLSILLFHHCLLNQLQWNLSRKHPKHTFRAKRLRLCRAVHCVILLQCSNAFLKHIDEELLLT